MATSDMVRTVTEVMIRRGGGVVKSRFVDLLQGGGAVHRSSPKSTMSRIQYT